MALGYFLIFLSATGFGLLPIFALYSYEHGVDSTTLLFLRFAFAAVFFFSYIFLKKKHWKITRKQLLSLIFMGGVLYTFQSFFYFSAIQYIPASLAALLLYLYPVFVTILSFFVNKERISNKLLLSIFISLIGMIFVLGSPGQSMNVIGILLAMGAAIVYSIYIVYGNRITVQVPPVATSAFIALFASVSFFFGGLYTGGLDFKFEPPGWLGVAGISLFSSVIAMLTFFSGMKLVGPSRASILSMIEPVVTILFSTLLFNEKMTFLQMAGGLIVLGGAVMVVLLREKNELTSH
ncbi:DMT family transporter [Bacillus sp. T33-2]|uniref:DMT family transporter n=1 Tax=Bacillus sp. T33-2 TaxID=2054168 RepID=UPI000C791874|nr:DMT family transporter [Bacillus sp. T33-2]PLR95060.1 EamA family transporter [Bacillus sp. T33-2]